MDYILILMVLIAGFKGFAAAAVTVVTTPSTGNFRGVIGNTRTALAVVVALRAMIIVVNQEALGPTGLELAVFLVVWALVEAANGFQSWQLRQKYHLAEAKREILALTTDLLAAREDANVDKSYLLMKVAKSERATKEAEGQLFEAREEIISARRETVSVWKEVVSVKKIVAAQADDIYITGRKLRDCERELESTQIAAAEAAALRLQERQQGKGQKSADQGVCGATSLDGPAPTSSARPARYMWMVEMEKSHAITRGGGGSSSTSFRDQRVLG